MKNIYLLLILLISVNTLPWLDEITLANSLEVGRDQDPNTWGCVGCNDANKPIITKFIEQDVQAVRAQLSIYQDYTILAFRYTANINNIWQDAQFLIKKQDQHAPKGANVQKIWDQMWEAIKIQTLTGLRNDPDKTRLLVITGISLGGALAQLSYVDIKQANIFNNIQLITWGQPRVGNTKWSNWFDSMISTRRFYLKDDIVPDSPTCFTKLICDYALTGYGISCDKKSDTDCTCTRVYKNDKKQDLQIKLKKYQIMANILVSYKQDQNGDLNSILDHIFQYKNLYHCQVSQ